ncbi:hypothetical protein ACHAWF_003825 [Thalassiosira exigua]
MKTSTIRRGALFEAGTNQSGSKSGAWSYLPTSLPFPASDMDVSLASAGGDLGGARRIVLTGGCVGKLGMEYASFRADEWFECSVLSNKTFAFDPIRRSDGSSGEYDELADMPRTRNRHASAIVGGKVYVFGGRDETDLIIPEERLTSDHAAVAMEDNLVYIIRGYAQDYTALEQVTAIDMTDPTYPTYADGPPLKSTRGDVDAVVLDDGTGDAYVSGGFTHENQ